MSRDFTLGRILSGNPAEIEAQTKPYLDLRVDQTFFPEVSPLRAVNQTTLGGPFSRTGPGTYLGKANRTLNFEPYHKEGWWFNRTDQPDQLPIQVSARNVWTTIRSIVLRSGSPHNYMRMVEHIIALRLGMGLDNVMISIDSGDPPLFNVGSMDIVEGVEEVGIVDQPDMPLQYWKVKEPVTVGGRNGSFLTILPPEDENGGLYVDCAVDFSCAIKQQRIQFELFPESFRLGAHARTNCTRGMMFYTKTIGKLFADVRHLGYTRDNILIAGKNDYVNEPKLIHDGKSLEAVWHRAVLDLIAALGLLETGRLTGRVYSYKAGHALDVHMVTQLYLHDLLEPA
jgi:UDP-3-O-acyl-N-acetylglucosamine deacetylase